MRAEVVCESGRFIKRVESPGFLFKHLTTNLTGYRNWLHKAGFKTPDTKVHYKDGYIIFDQEQIDAGICENVKSVISKFRQLSFDIYGLDSNPRNFLGERDVYFVDFFPLLTRNTLALEQQFDYPSGEATQRYFTLENVLMFYVVRAFKENPVWAYEALKLVKSDLLAKYETVLPREKVRLLNALLLSEQGKILEYPQFYADTKKLTTITSSENDELRFRLN